MNNYRLTPDRFDKDLRSTLRYRHEFDHEDLEKAKGIVHDAVEHIAQKMDTKRGMGAEHLDTAMNYLHEEHEGWRKLPEHKKRAIETTLRQHFGMTDE